jgi:hypothetical protein
MRKNTVTSIVSEKHSTKFNTLLIKVLNKLGTEGMEHKVIYEKLITNTKCNGKRLKVFLLRAWAIKDTCPYHFYSK